MNKKFARILVVIVAIVTVAVMCTACSREIIYRYETSNRASSGTGTGTNSGTGTGTNSGTGNTSQGGSGSTNQGGTGTSSGQGGGSSAVIEDSKGDGTTYKLKVWCATEDREMIQKMLDNYADRYSANHYVWTVQNVGENDAATKVEAAIDDAADVFSFASDQIGKLMNKKALVQIPASYCGETGQIGQQIGVAQQACTYEGEVYAFPYCYENTFLYYNKSKITDVSSLEAILNASIDGVQYNLGIDMGDSYYTTMFLYTAGVNIYGENGNDPNSVDLNNDATKKACRYIASLGGQKKLGSVLRADQYAALKNGKVAALISGPHMISQFQDALGKNFGVAMLPTIRFTGESKDSQLISFSGVKMYGITRKTGRDDKTTQEAIKLAAYLSNTENQVIRLEDRDFCPTEETLFADALESGKETVEVVIAQSDFCRLKPGLKGMAEYWDNMGNFLLGVYNNEYGEAEWEKYLVKIETAMKGNQ